MVFDEGKGLSSEAQQYDPTSIINEVRHYVDAWRALPSPRSWQVTPEIWRRGLRRTYARLAAAGIPTIVIRGTPRTWFDVPSCLSRRAAGLPFAGDCAYDRARSLSSVAVAAQNAAARGLPIHFVDMNDQICAAPRCGVVRGGVVVFTDDNHLTRTFSRSVAPVLGVRLEAALAGSTRR